MRIRLFQLTQQPCVILNDFLPVPNEHYSTLRRDLEMFGTGCTVTESLFCTLKRLLLSSRSQASCCPRCWSLRSKTRLPQCCESGPAQGKRRQEKHLQRSAQLLWRARTSFLPLRRLSTFLILKRVVLMDIKVWCTLWCYSNSQHMQKSAFIGF